MYDLVSYSFTRDDEWAAHIQRECEADLNAKGLTVHTEGRLRNIGGGSIGRMNVTLWNGSKMCLASFALMDMPGCCGALVSTGLAVRGDHYKQGLGTITHKIQDAVARATGIGWMQCTVHASNVAERGLLTKTGWECVGSFINGRTGNKIETWRKIYDH